MKLDIQSRSGRSLLPDGIIVADGATVEDLKQRFGELKRQYYPARQRFTLPSKPGQRTGLALEAGKKLSDYGLADGDVLVFKDLGPQIGYRTVFFWEYLGPMLIYPLFYFLPQAFYPGFKAPQRYPVQTLATAYWVFHYTKRIMETFFVHRFGKATMPVFNLFKNCTYYWGFAAFVGYFVNHPLYTPPPLNRSYAALLFSLACQLANFRCHLILSNLRPARSSGITIGLPRGFLFEFISCPNYTAEIMGWVGFTVATQALPAAIFTLVGAGQMAVWAAGKHRRLKKTFDGLEGRPRYPRRWVMLPPFY